VLEEGRIFGTVFIGRCEFQKFVQLKSSQFGDGKRLINGTKKLGNLAKKIYYGSSLQLK